jgi:hypothetical protein
VLLAGLLGCLLRLLGTKDWRLLALCSQTLAACLPPTTTFLLSRLATTIHIQLPCMHACRQAYNMEAVYVHDAAAFAAVVDPGLFEWQQGGVLVVTEGPAKGRTIRDEGGLPF